MTPAGPIARRIAARRGEPVPQPAPKSTPKAEPCRPAWLDRLTAKELRTQ